MQKRIEFSTSDRAPSCPIDNVTTDVQRLQQILKNILSNAFKFTDHGRVESSTSTSAWPRPIFTIHDILALSQAKGVLAFAVSDSGIGIPEEKQQLIFEAFQQADTTTRPEIRGHGPGPDHQPGTGPPIGR